MKHRPSPNYLMPDSGAGGLLPDATDRSIREPRIRRMTADHHPIELPNGDPALDALVELVGIDGMKEFGQFVSGGFRMVELLGLIDDPDDQLPAYIVDDLKPHVPVLTLISTEVKLIANALMVVALRGLGATICGPYEQPEFLHPTKSTSSKVLAWKLLTVPGVSEVMNGDVWWSEVPPVLFDIADPDAYWQGYIPNPSYIVELFLS